MVYELATIPIVLAHHHRRSIAMKQCVLFLYLVITASALAQMPKGES